MLSEKIEKELNKQLNAEIYSAYLYLSMAAYFDSINLEGLANWMKAQAKEEMEHAMRFYNFIYDRGGTVNLESIAKPPSRWDSPVDAFKKAYEHEVNVTQMIYSIVSAAKEEKDYATENFLQWFIEEQVEEESSVGNVVKKLEMVKDSKNGLFMLDSKLGERK